MTAYPIRQRPFYSAGSFMKLRLLLEDSCNKDCSEIHLTELSEICDELRQTWRETAFSTMPDYALKRYFSFQLESIRDILDTSSFPELHDQGHPVKDELISLINYQFQYFKNHLDADLVSPRLYRIYKLASLDRIVNDLMQKLKHSAIDEKLRNIVESYLEEMRRMDPAIYDTYHSLNYFEKFMSELLRLNLVTLGAEDLLILKLINLNFNHAGFYSYLRNKICMEIAHLDKVAAIQLLEMEKGAIVHRLHDNLIYDKAWPGITEMLSAFLNEEIQKINALSSLVPYDRQAPVTKLNLDLSVAHLALLIKLFFEENFLKNNTLTSVFKFVSRNYSTKRQLNISPASLSKEFYSVNQVTAAVVRDMLQKMIARINRTFFPVLAVISTAILCCLNTH